MTEDLITPETIAQLVPAFYAKVRKDAVLGPIFNGAISDWPQHLETLQSFWSSVMLTSGQYKGQPMMVHFHHEQHMKPENFARWLALWRETSEELLAPDVAAAFQEKADRIAESLQLGVQFLRQRGGIT